MKHEKQMKLPMKNDVPTTATCNLLKGKYLLLEEGSN